MRILECFNFFVLCYILEKRKTTAGHIITEKNVSLEWINDFVFTLSSSKCQNYTVAFTTYTEEIVQLPWKTGKVMDGNSLNLTLTQCDGSESPPVHFRLRYPELLKDLDCYQTSNKEAVCSWTPKTEELQFFYVIVNEDTLWNENEFIQRSFQAEECPSYSHNRGVKTGCRLQRQASIIFVSFRGGRNGSYVNTFRRPLYAKPPALNWNVSKSEDKFQINWDNPDIPADWEITIKYKECDELKSEIVRNRKSWDLNRLPECPYSLAIQAKSLKGHTPWSEFRDFEADAPSTSTYAAVFIPLVFVLLTIVALLCCRRNKDRLFPRIPQPRDLISGISNSPFKFAPDNIYSHSKEELCQISLVPELQRSSSQGQKRPRL